LGIDGTKQPTSIGGTNHNRLRTNPNWFQEQETSPKPLKPFREALIDTSGHTNYHFGDKSDPKNIDTFIKTLVKSVNRQLQIKPDDQETLTSLIEAGLAKFYKTERLKHVDPNLIGIDVPSKTEPAGKFTKIWRKIELVTKQEADWKLKQEI